MSKLDELIVMVNQHLPSNAIVVSPELFRRMKAAQDGNLDELDKETDEELQRVIDRIKPLKTEVL